jgi:hypothetical protein
VRHRALLLLATAACAASAPAQDSSYTLRAPGNTPAEMIVHDALSRRHIVRHEQFNTRLFRDSVFDTTVVIVSSDATVASTVHGDVLVIDGDLFLQPGARIDGSAIAIGGGVYDSQQAHVGGEKLSFRDAHFDTVRTSRGVELVYRPPQPAVDTARVVSLPLLFGLRVPTYDRVNGLALPFGPRLTIGGGRVVVDPTVTYRSNLGAYDLAATLRADIGSGWSATAFGGKTTLTNDEWIQTDLANSLSTIGVGNDYRNYWRAARYEARVAHGWELPDGDVSVWGGGRTEDDWSVHGGGPWSLFGRSDTLHMQRSNPAVERGRLSSALAGARASWRSATIEADARAEVEVVLDAPNGARFTQTTVDAHTAFPTFVSKLGTQSFEFRTHLVLTAGDSAPPQRFAYIGGTGTLPTFDILSRGGDQVVFLEGLYNFPIETLHVPYLGTPIITLREMFGATGISHLGSYDNNLGLRLTLGIFRGEFFVNPENGDHSLALGLSLLR